MTLYELKQLLKPLSRAEQTQVLDEYIAAYNLDKIDPVSMLEFVRYVRVFLSKDI